MMITFAIVAFGYLAARLLFRSPRGSIRQGFGAAFMVIGDGLLIALVMTEVLPIGAVLASLLGNCLGILRLPHLGSPLYWLKDQYRQLHAARTERARLKRQELDIDQLLPWAISEITALAERCESSTKLSPQKDSLTRLGAYLEAILDRYLRYRQALAELRGISIGALRATGADEALAELKAQQDALEVHVRLLAHTIEALPVHITAAELSGDTSHLDRCLTQIEKTTEPLITDAHRLPLNIHDEIAAIGRPVPRAQHLSN